MFQEVQPSRTNMMDIEKNNNVFKKYKRPEVTNVVGRNNKMFKDSHCSTQ